jgi:hypothetical protein
MKKIMMTILLMGLMLLITGCYNIYNNKALQVKTQEEGVAFFLNMLKDWDTIKVDSTGMDVNTTYFNISQNKGYVEYFARDDVDKSDSINYGYFSRDLYFWHNISDGSPFYRFGIRTPDFGFDTKTFMDYLEHTLTNATFSKDGVNIKFSFNIATDTYIEGSYQYKGDSKIYFYGGGEQQVVITPSSNTVLESKYNAMLADFEGKITSVEGPWNP